MIDRYGGMETEREREERFSKNKTKLSTGIEEDMVCWQEQLLMSYRT